MSASLVGSEMCIRDRPDKVRRHCLTHVPYQSWCDVCVRSRGPDQQHRRIDEAARGDERLVQIDYLFLSGSLGPTDDESSAALAVGGS
eukprot:2006359-Alexandrium_andersonii.AAC.1